MEEHGMAFEWGTWYVDPENLSWLHRWLIRLRLKTFPRPLVVPKPDNLIEMLSESAEKHLSRGTRYEIREMIPFDYGLRRGMAWYSTPQMQQEETWDDLREPDTKSTFGYRLVRRLVVA